MSGLVPPGHKVATRAIAVGEPVKRYNQIIGFAKRPSRPASTCICTTWRWATFDARLRFRCGRKADAVRRSGGHIQGIVRAGRARGNAQLLGISVDGELLGHGCARHRRSVQGRARWPQFPNVDGVVALTHGSGCGMDVQGEEHAGSAPHAGRLRATRQLRRRADRGTGLRGQPDQRRCSAPRASRKVRCCDFQHPGHRRHGEDHRARDRDHQGDAAARERRRARHAFLRRNHPSAFSAAARTAIRASPPIRRWVRRSTCWYAMAARPFFPKRRRSTVPSTCSRGAPCRAKSARS